MKKQLLEFLNTYLTNDEIRFLSKGWVMVRALGTLVFVVCFISCENEIEYHGDNEKQQLVISADMAAGTQPACYVCSTTPTLGNVQLDTVWYERVYSDGHTERYYRMEHSRAFLSDASVRMRFNEGDWHTAVYNTDSKQYLVSGYTLSAGDRIELEVNHTTLGTATATQTVPKPVTVSAIHTTDLYPRSPKTDGYGSRSTSMPTRATTMPLSVFVSTAGHSPARRKRRFATRKRYMTRTVAILIPRSSTTPSWSLIQSRSPFSMPKAICGTYHSISRCQAANTAVLCNPTTCTSLPRNSSRANA